MLNVNCSQNTRSSPSLPTTKFIFTDATSHDYLSERERFSGITADLEREHRQKQYLQKQQILQQKRESRIKDYEERRKKIEEDYQKEQQRLANRASYVNVGKKNNMATAYNPISLDYHPSEDGKLLKYRDDLAKHRASQRMYNLDTKRNCAYNPINGQPRVFPSVTPRPLYN